MEPRSPSLPPVREPSHTEAILASAVGRLDELILRAKGGLTEQLAGEFCNDLGAVRTALEEHSRVLARPASAPARFTP